MVKHFFQSQVIQKLIPRVSKGLRKMVHITFDDIYLTICEWGLCKLVEIVLKGNFKVYIA